VSNDSLKVTQPMSDGYLNLKVQSVNFFTLSQEWTEPPGRSYKTYFASSQVVVDSVSPVEW
jgi:hypothetical protein